MKNENTPATAADVDAGNAVFSVPDSRSRVHELGFSLPADAVLKVDLDVGEAAPIRAGTSISIVQAEMVDNSYVVLGFTYAGGKGVCSLEEVGFRPK